MERASEKQPNRCTRCGQRWSRQIAPKICPRCGAAVGRDESAATVAPDQSAAAPAAPTTPAAPAALDAVFRDEKDISKVVEQAPRPAPAPKDKDNGHRLSLEPITDPQEVDELERLDDRGLMFRDPAE